MDDREQARNRSRQHPHQIARTVAGHRRLSERAWERPRRARDPWARLRVASSSALLPVILRSGNVVESIVDAAIEFDVDAIAMPTAGHHGILDALRGSTTERVIRHAPCPVFALSAASPGSG